MRIIYWIGGAAVLVVFTGLLLLEIANAIILGMWQHIIW